MIHTKNNCLTYPTHIPLPRTRAPPRPLRLYMFIVLDSALKRVRSRSYLAIGFRE